MTKMDDVLTFVSITYQVLLEWNAAVYIEVALQKTKITARGRAHLRKYLRKSAEEIGRISSTE